MKSQENQEKKEKDELQPLRILQKPLGLSSSISGEPELLEHQYKRILKEGEALSKTPKMEEWLRNVLKSLEGDLGVQLPPDLEQKMVQSVLPFLRDRTIPVEALRFEEAVPEILGWEPDQAQVKAILEVAQRGLHGLETFVRNRIIPTLRAWEQAGTGFPYQHVDLLLQWLIRFTLPECHPSVRSFAAALAGYLDNRWPIEDHVREHVKEFLGTWAGIAEWLIRGERTECFLQAVFYLHHRLIFFPTEDTYLSHAQVYFKILSAALGELLDHTGRREDGIPVVNRIYTAAVWLTVREATLRHRSTAELALRTLGAGVRDARGIQPQPEWALYMHEIVALPPAWAGLAGKWVDRLPEWGEKAERLGERILLTPEVRVALMEAWGAALRPAVVDPEDYDDIPSAFFNSGVSLLRWHMKLENQQQRDRNSWLRAFINTLGLWTALHLASDLREAMSHLHGLSCVTNLFGAITDVVQDRDTLREYFADLVKAAIILGKNQDTLRLRLAWGRYVGIDELMAPGEVAPLEELKETANRVLEFLFKQMGVEEKEQKKLLMYRDPPELAVVLALAVQKGFIWRLGEEEYDRHAEQILRLLENLSNFWGTPQEALKDYRTLFDHSTGPLAVLGLVGGKKETDLIRQWLPKIPSLADWLQRYSEWIQHLRPRPGALPLLEA